MKAVEVITAVDVSKVLWLVRIWPAALAAQPRDSSCSTPTPTPIYALHLEQRQMLFVQQLVVFWIISKQSFLESLTILVSNLEVNNIRYLELFIKSECQRVGCRT